MTDDGPRTEAGRRLYDGWSTGNEGGRYDRNLRSAILAIEAEAAAGPRGEGLREALKATVDAWDRYVEAHAGRGHDGDHEPEPKLDNDCGPCVSAMYGTEVDMAEYVIPAARAALQAATPPENGL
jgi:hypothetical protein